MQLVMLPYKETSKGSAMMARALNIARISREGVAPDSLVIVLNWGRGDFPQWYRRVRSYINHPEAVMTAINKASAFRQMSKAGVPCVEFTTNFREAREWSNAGHTVFCRKELQGKDGSGIIVARKPAELVEAEGYTKYVRKVHEYRVHVMNGEPFYANIKTKKRDMPDNADPLIRSGSHGWYFSHMDDLPSKRVCDAAISAVAALGLDFGGVDVGESDNGEVRVYEVNTAPEMGPNTTMAYLNAFKKHYGNYNNNENIPIRNL